MSTWNNLAHTGHFFMKFDIWVFFWKSSFIKMRQEWCVLSMKTNIHFLSYLSQFFLEWKMFQINIVEKIKTHILCSMFFKKSCCLWDNVEKYCRAEQTTNDNMAYAHCMPNSKGYKYTLKMCNAYCFSTATMVAWTCLSVMLYIHCLSVAVSDAVTSCADSMVWCACWKILQLNNVSPLKS
jgi:hypothetical protein